MGQYELIWPKTIFDDLEQMAKVLSGHFDLKALPKGDRWTQGWFTSYDRQGQISSNGNPPM